MPAAENSVSSGSKERQEEGKRAGPGGFAVVPPIVEADVRLRVGISYENQIAGWYENYIKLKNFGGGLVLGCIDADFYVQILIGKHFSRSTRFENLCTATNPKFCKILTTFFLEILLNHVFNFH